MKFLKVKSHTLKKYNLCLGTMGPRGLPGLRGDKGVPGPMG